MSFVDRAKTAILAILEADPDADHENPAVIAAAESLAERVSAALALGSASDGEILSYDSTAEDIDWVEAPPPGGAAGGDLGGNYPNPTVVQARGLRETAGPTTLSMGAVAAGAVLRRSVSGSSVAGISISALRALVLPRTADVVLSSSQSSPGSGDHVEFDVAAGKLVSDGLVTLSMGTGQQRGVVTLAAGHAYRLIAIARGVVGANASRTMRLRLSDGSHVDSISATGTSATLIHSIDSDGTNADSTTGMVSAFETEQLSADADVVLQVESAHSAIAANTRIMISEIAS